MRNILLFFYLIVNIFLYILNIELFNSVVDIDFGFFVLSFIPLVMLQMIGLIFVLAFYYLDKNKETKKKIEIERLYDKNTIQQKELEIVNLKLENKAIENTIVEIPSEEKI